MTDVSFADVEYQIKYLPADTLPIVNPFIRDLSVSFERIRSGREHPEKDYDFTKTKLWIVRGIASIIEDDSEATQKGIRKITNYADTVDEIAYGVSLSKVQRYE